MYDVNYPVNASSIFKASYINSWNSPNGCYVWDGYKSVRYANIWSVEIKLEPGCYGLSIQGIDDGGLQNTVRVYYKENTSSPVQALLSVNTRKDWRMANAIFFVDTPIYINGAHSIETGNWSQTRDTWWLFRITPPGYWTL